MDAVSERTSVRVSRGWFRGSTQGVLQSSENFLEIGPELKLHKSQLLCQRLVSGHSLELTYLAKKQVTSSTVVFEDKRSCSDWFVRLSEILSRPAGEKALLVFVNPYGGKKTGRLVWKYRAEPLFRAAGREFERIYTNRGGHITDFCQNVEIDKYSGIVVVGGDGSIAEAVNGLFAHKDERARSFPVGIIPAGSSNALAKARDLLDAKVAAFHIIKGNLGSYDLVKVAGEEGQPFFSLCMISLGFISDVNALAKDSMWRDMFGPARYEICGLRRILCGGSITKYQAQVKLRRRGLPEWEKLETEEASWDLISPELFSRGERTNKAAGDGLVLVTHSNPIRLLQFFSKFSSDKLHEALHGDKYHIYQDVEEVEIATNTNIPFSIDGELHPFKSVKVQLVSAALRLFGGAARSDAEDTHAATGLSDFSSGTLEPNKAA